MATPSSRPTTAKRHLLTRTSTAPAFALALGAALCAPPAAAGGTCSETTQLAQSACLAGTRDDFFTATAVCTNLKDSRRRQECQGEAAAAQSEAREECAEQEDARAKLCHKLGEAPYDPDFRAANFLSAAASAAAPHPLLPLVPGMRWKYAADDETIVVEVLDEYKTIGGVQCRTVRDTVTVEIDGAEHVVEDTFDWFAQDRRGNVWYCGEISQSYDYIRADHAVELVSVEGSWKATRDGAKPGIVMPARPAVGQVYRQEFDLGNAEDVARVIGVGRSATATVGSCTRTCLITRETSPLEPGHAENKVYSPGYGLILEIDPETHEVKAELVEMTAPLIPM